MTIFIRLFGGAALETGDGVVVGPAAQRHRLALLALLAASPSRALTRDKLMALLWPERDAAHARKLLNQAVYVLRKALGENTIVSAGEELRLEPAVVDCDVVAFQEAIETGELEQAVELYAGAFLDGFHLGGAAAFERWVDRERQRLADAYADALEALAEAAEAGGDLRAAVEWWKLRAGHDPYDSRVALRMVWALAEAGHPAGALRHAEVHARRLREELGIEAPQELGNLVDRIRREPSAPLHVEDERETFEHPEQGRPATSIEAAGAPSADLRRRMHPRKLPAAARSVAAILFLAAIVLGGIRLAAGPSGEAVPDRGVDFADEEVGPAAGEADRREWIPSGARSGQRRTRSIAAHELYLRASDPALLRNDSTAWRAWEYFRQAIALDSTYAAAWAGLACLSLRVSTARIRGSGAGSRYGEGSGPELRALADEAARRAVALDDSLAAAHAATGLVRMVAYEFGAAENHLKRAIRLDPTFSRAREWLVTTYLWTGRAGEALAEAERVLQRDPLSPTAHAEVARALAGNGRCDEALARLNELESLEPPLLRTGAIAAQCHFQNGAWRDAIDVLRTQVKRAPGNYSLALLAHALGRAGHVGDVDEAQRIRADLLDQWRRHAASAFPLAIVYAGLGDVDQTVGWLDEAIEDQSLIASPDHFTVLNAILQPFGDDPRLVSLRERLALGSW